MKAKKTARSYERKADHITPVEYSVLQQAVDHYHNASQLITRPSSVREVSTPG
jgi:hypothetical protein